MTSVPVLGEPRVPPTEALRRGFDLATASAPGGERRVVIAGRPVLFRFAGAVLERRLTAAFDHLPAWAAPGRPALTVSAWDSVSTGVGPPAALPASRGNQPAGTRWRYGERSVQVSWWPRHSMLMAFDASARQAWWWIADGAATPWWEAAAPLRPILHWWAATEGCHLLHAGGVGTAAGGALLVGPGGSGKSTLALASLQGTLAFAGDDYVLLEPGRPFAIHSLYGTAKLDPAGAGRVRLRTAVPWEGPAEPGAKLVAHLVSRFRARISAGFPARVIVAPRITADGPRLLPLSRPAALRALAPSTLLQLADVGAVESLDAMARLLDAVPAYRLDVGPDPLAAISLVEGFLSDG